MVYRIVKPREEIRAAVGTDIGVSRWFAVEQDRIDAFAEVTEDHQFVHVDPERAAETMFGGTVAHGFLTLSLLSAMAYDCVPQAEGAAHGVNYGFDRIRFVAPVPAGARVRGRFHLERLVETAEAMTAHYTVTVEIEGEERPAIAADWIGRVYFEPAAD
ncbi:MAG: MaoC family dehydratase [Pseudomonadota bacterium]